MKTLKIEKYPDAPPHLSARAATLWKKLGPSHASTDGRQVAFQMMLECLDRLDEARTAVSADGLSRTTKASGAVHASPMLKIEKESREQFVKLWKALGLNREPNAAADALMAAAMSNTEGG